MKNEFKKQESMEVSGSRYDYSEDERRRGKRAVALGLMVLASIGIGAGYSRQKEVATASEQSIGSEESVTPEAYEIQTSRPENQRVVEPVVPDREFALTGERANLAGEYLNSRHEELAAIINNTILNLEKDGYVRGASDVNALINPTPASRSIETVVSNQADLAVNDSAYGGAPKVHVTRKLKPGGDVIQVDLTQHENLAEATDPELVTIELKISRLGVKDRDLIGTLYDIVQNPASDIEVTKVHTAAQENSHLVAYNTDKFSAKDVEGAVEFTSEEDVQRFINNTLDEAVRISGSL